MLSEGWIKVSVAEICTVTAGIGFPKKYQGKTKGQFPFFKVGDISKTVQKGEHVLKKSDNYISNSVCKILKGKPIPIGATVFAKIGEAIMLNRHAITSEESLFDNNVMVLIPKKQIILDIFLFHFFNTIKLKKFSISTIVPSIRKSDIENIMFLLPPLPEQQKIASILCNVDALIESTQDVVDKSEKLKKGLMQKLLTRGIEHDKFKKVKWMFGKEIEISKEWDWERLDDNSTLKGRIGWQGLTTAEYRQHGKYYLVTGTDFKNGKIDWDNCVYVDKDRFDQDSNIQLKKEDVLVTKDGTIGKIAFVDRLPLSSTLNTGVFVIRPLNKSYDSLFLYYILYSNYFIKFLNRLKGGSTINHLYQKDFVDFCFPIPPSLEQQKIASILSGVDAYIQKTRQKVKVLKNKSIKILLANKILAGV